MRIDQQAVLIHPRPTGMISLVVVDQQATIDRAIHRVGIYHPF